MPASPKRRRKRLVFTKVVAHLPNSVELTKLKSENSMTVEIRSGDALLGTLIMGRGSVQWWPSGNRVNAARKSWKQFADMLSKAMCGVFRRFRRSGFDKIDWNAGCIRRLDSSPEGWLFPQGHPSSVGRAADS